MFRSVWLVPLAGAVLLTTNLAFAQDRDPERAPTIGQRLGKFGKSLFGGGEDETIVAEPPKQGRGRGTTPPRRGAAQKSSRPNKTHSAIAQSAPPAAHPADAPARSSRRTFQPGYQPGDVPTEPVPPEDLSQTEAAPSQMTPGQRPMSEIPSGMPSAYAGPSRPARPADKSKVIENSPADRSTSDSEEPSDDPAAMAAAPRGRKTRGSHEEVRREQR